MILSWYRQNVTDFGLARATGLLARVVLHRAQVKFSNAVLSKQQACPCCGWEGHRLLDYHEAGYTVPNVACPNCDSHSRHRAFFLWLKQEYRLGETSGNALVFAPERALADLWESAANLRIYRLDVVPSRGVTVLADIMRLPFDSETADLIWCHHVIEQVDDDRLALSELRRVLRAGGDLIISAGLSREPFTKEFGFADKSLSGNRRSYGADFPDRLGEAGFTVKRMSYGLSEEELRRYAIYEEPFFLCRRNAQ